MRSMPGELSELVGQRRFDRLLRSPPLAAPDRVSWRPNAASTDRSAALIALLEERLAPHLEPMCSMLPDPKRSRTNYGEELPKVMQNQTVMLDRRRTKAVRAARGTGVVDLLRSTSTRRLAEHISGHRLGSEVGCQVIRYGPGGYVGPHHDGHPEFEELRDGYVDLHISLPSPAVRSQLLVVEDRGHLCRVIDVGAAPGITVSVLPTWHQVTPLVPKRGHDRACRWLLLVSFEIERG